jgi:DNA-binding NtrC family response regulator
MSDRPRSFGEEEIPAALLARLDERVCLPGRLLEELVAGALSGADAHRVQAHLLECLSCLSRFARIQGLRHQTAETGAAARPSLAAVPRPGRGSVPSIRLVDSPSARALQRELDRLAQLDRGPGNAPSVLIVGERGTGKSLVAQAIHALSRRSARPFVEVRCWALPAEGMALELFGREGTPPALPHAGLLERADGGTVLLDGVHRVPLDVQRTLVRTLEEGAVRRLGGRAAQPLEVRVIAATDADLEDAVRSGAFRGDLLRRLNELSLALPPLRERPDDIVPLARYFAARTAEGRGLSPARLSPEAEARLGRYHWPGNVGELAAVIERAVLRRRREAIDAQDIDLPE